MPTLTRKLVADDLESLQTVAATAGPEKNVPQLSWAWGGFSSQNAPGVLGSGKDWEGARLDCAPGSREITFPGELEGNLSSWRFGAGGRGWMGGPSGVE